MRNFLCEATGVNCVDPRCKRGSCILEQEIASAAVAVLRMRKDADRAKPGRSRTIDAAHASRVLFEAVRGMSAVEIRERLGADRELVRLALAVPRVRAAYDRIMKEKRAK
jgi:hypothetical protein